MQLLFLFSWPEKNTKDHKCDYCERFFYQSSNLKKIVHDGNKDYKCEQCGKYVTKLSIVRKDIKIVHEGLYKRLQKSYMLFMWQIMFWRRKFKETYMVHEGVKIMISTTFFKYIDICF